MVLTRDAVWKYTYVLPWGMEFPAGTSAEVRVTDRSSALLGIFEGEVGEREAKFLVDPDDHEHIPAGANFEIFVILPEGPHKVRYGRVVRREVTFPLAPVATGKFTPMMFEDTFDRNAVGPYWTPKYGRVGMHPLTGVPASAFGMAVRNALNIFGQGLTLWQDAAVLWYSPVASDTIELKVGLATQPAWLGTGDGECIVVICSNYTMKNWLGVRFRDAGLAGNSIQIVTGTGPIRYNTPGVPVSHTVPTSGQYYTIKYNHPTKMITVHIGNSATPALVWTDNANLVLHGAGHRYFGAAWNGSAIHPGPAMFYFKVMDAV